MQFTSTQNSTLITRNSLFPLPYSSLHKHATVEPRHTRHDAKQLVAIREQEGVAAHFKEPHAVGGKAAEANLVDADFEVGDGVNALSNGEDKLIGSRPAGVGVVAEEAIKDVIAVGAHKHVIAIGAGEAAARAATGFVEGGGEFIVAIKDAYLREGPARSEEHTSEL